MYQTTKGEFMKAGIYLGKEKVKIQELPLPEVGDYDVLIQNIYSSICVPALEVSSLAYKG